MHLNDDEVEGVMINLYLKEWETCTTPEILVDGVKSYIKIDGLRHNMSEEELLFMVEYVIFNISTW